MSFYIIRRLAFILLFSGLFCMAFAQPENDFSKKFAKPYRILSTGKQITVKSTEDIKSIMVWTSSGHRIIEQKEVNASSFSFRVNVNERIFFVMLELKGNKRYTEKIGVQ